MRSSRICCGSVLDLLWAMTFASVASAQGYRPIVDHLHLAAPDPLPAVAWYRKYFGGDVMAEAHRPPSLGDVRVIFSEEREDAAEPGERRRSHRLLGREPRRDDEGAPKRMA